MTINNNNVVWVIVLIGFFACGRVNTKTNKVILDNPIVKSEQRYSLNSKSYRAVEYKHLLSKSFKMVLRKPYHVQKENYEEGVFYVYSFEDSASIIVFEGAMLTFELEKYLPEKMYKFKNHNIKVGGHNGKFWRIDQYEGIKLFYENVNHENKQFYDNILDSIIIKSL